VFFTFGTLPPPTVKIEKKPKKYSRT